VTKYIIYDIDGCCVNCEERAQHIETDYEKYLALHHTDKPIPQGVLVYSLLLEMSSAPVMGHNGQVEVMPLEHVFVTARGEDQRANTERLLKVLFPDATFRLLMRHVDHRGRPDTEVKLEMIVDANIRPDDIFMAFDDRACNVEMYRSLGIVAYQTAVGY